MIAAAALCPAAPLLARGLTGADSVLPRLRQECLAAVAALAQAAPEAIAVVGAAAQTQAWDGASALDLTIFAPAIDAPGGTPDLPPSLGLGALLLDQARYRGRRILQSVGQDEPASRCASLGARLAASDARLGLLVMADGSARRGLRAPGHLDQRSAPFDAEVERAVREGNLAALLVIDQALAAELMATGRAAWQVLAGALSGPAPVTRIRYADDPFGVAYLVASLEPSQPARS
jgi:hypothetical protein